MNIRIDKADSVFSQYIRLRDGSCQRCGNVCETLQASHFYGRSKESTRFDPDNVDALCYGCHVYWGSTDREAYREFKIKQLGKQGFKMLIVRANTYKKKDRKMEYIIWKTALEDLKNNVHK
jgi:hypothetical protein